MIDDVIGKWGGIGFIAGAIMPYIIGGWIEEYSLITALGGAFLFQYIAQQGAKAYAEQYGQNIQNENNKLMSLEEQGFREHSSRESVNTIRSASDIITEFGLTRDEFLLIFSSYKFSLGQSNEAGGWNDDIDEFSRSINALSEEEIALGKVDFERAILNRIILRNVAERSVQRGQTPIKSEKS